MASWFPVGKNNQPGWRLDIVSLLAVIGESAMEDHAQKMTATWLCLLPRLIPAPQGILKSQRPKRLPPVPGITVVGAFSGTKVGELNYAANMMLEIEELSRYEFREYYIDYKYDHQGRTGTRVELEKGFPDAGAPPGVHELTSQQEYLNSHGRHERVHRLEARMISSENALTLGSCLMTIGLFIWSLVLHDGVAALSLACMSMTSTLTGLAFWWTPILTIRPSSAVVPKGDLVLKTREGAFVVVHCSEEIARELFIGSEGVHYHFGNKSSRAFVGFGTFFLMVAVVLLGNCNWTMQAAIGVSYLILNGTYWLVSLLPERHCWHMSAYKVTPGKLPYHMSHAHDSTDQRGLGGPPSLTRTLWYAIQRSKSGLWIKAMEAAPQTEAWDEWIQEAVKHAHDEDWRAVDRKNEIMLTGLSSASSNRGSWQKDQIEVTHARVDSRAATTGLEIDIGHRRSPTITQDFQQSPGAPQTPQDYHH